MLTLRGLGGERASNGYIFLGEGRGGEEVGWGALRFAVSRLHAREASPGRRVALAARVEAARAISVAHARVAALALLDGHGRRRRRLW